MRRVVVRGLVRNRSPRELTELLSRFERYPTCTSTVISVDSEHLGDGYKRSAWEIQFGAGVLKWVEDEWIEPDHGRIAFKLVSGDLKRLEGWWRATPAGSDSEVTFDATFDSGLGPSEVVDPIAERVLREDFEVIMQAVIGDRLELVA
jgi:coenzyme Q-binding protein COQ10